ncbi:MAG: hypothetical protein KDE48_00235 [Anaerolineales bacterium]|nr:hypothetical protein [Anaerolineales bacterium]
MKEYNYCSINGSFLFTTDPKVGEVIYQEIKNFSPKAKVIRNEFPDGKVRTFYLKNTKTDEYECEWWILNILAQQGWKMIAANKNGLHFSKAIEPTE